MKPIIAKYTKLPEDEIQKVGLPTFSTETNIAELQELIDRMVKRGLISKKLDARELVYAQ
jgi:polyhydroxyalkanoate synthesis regulator phasin